MELRQLRLFVAVAEELSFTRAAQRLMMAQPPLSQGIQAFEAELGVTLFHRTTRRIELTSVGRELLPEARAILESAERFEQRAQARRRGELGELRLSTISGLATAELAKLLRRFRADHPGLSVSLDVHPSVWQMQALLAGSLDAGFLSLPPDRLEGLESLLLSRGRMSLAVPKDHRLAGRKRLRWTDLIDEPLILVEAEVTWSDYYVEFQKRCRAAGVDPQVSQYAPNVATQVWMVSAGLGIAPIQVSPPAGEWPGVVFLHLPPDAPQHEIRIAWRPLDPSPALGRFVEFVRDSALPLA